MWFLTEHNSGEKARFNEKRLEFDLKQRFASPHTSFIFGITRFYISSQNTIINTNKALIDVKLKINTHKNIFNWLLQKYIA